MRRTCSGRFSPPYPGVALTALAAIAGLSVQAQTTAPSRAAPPLPRLKAQGIHIVNARGDKVNLRGINLGSWFLPEMWMTPWVQTPPEGSPFGKVPDSVTLWATLEKRLGADAMERIRKAWRTTWMKPEDFRRIREAGFDHVRVPFTSEMLDEPGGMEWLRKSVKDANAAGLYAILDMHGAPGRQSADHTTGQAGVNRFFFDPAHVEKAEKIWASLGRVFGKHPGVAAFDLINEPTGAPNPATLHLVYNRLYHAVRKGAPDTIVIIDDGYKGFDTTPHADVAGWTNVVYSLHFYNFDAKSKDDHLNSLDGRMPRTLELRGYRNAPLYVGEFNIEPHSTPDTMARFTKTLTDNDISWAMWTYKTLAPGGPMGFWGYYSNPSAVDALDPFLDSESTLLKKMEQTATENLAVPAGLASVFRASDGTEARR